MARLLAYARHFSDQLFASFWHPNDLKMLWQSRFVLGARRPREPISSVASCAFHSWGSSFISSSDYLKRFAALLFSMVIVHFQPAVLALDAHWSCSPT